MRRVVGGGGGRVSKRPMHDYGEGEGGWPLVEISKEVFLQRQGGPTPPPPPFLLGAQPLTKFQIFKKGGLLLTKNQRI